MSAYQITLNPKTITRVLGKLALFFIVMGLVGQFFRIYTGHGRLHGLLPLFDLNQERNFPSYFSMLLLLAASALLMIITFLEKKRATVYIREWATLALGFLYLSLDEIISIHEAFTVLIRNTFSGDRAGIFYYAWVIPAIVILGFLTIYFFKFLLHLPAHYRRIFMLSGAIYVTGAVVMEMVGGYYVELHGDKDKNYLAISYTEESLEMFGVIVFIKGLLGYMSENFGEIRFSIDRT